MKDVEDLLRSGRVAPGATDAVRRFRSTAAEAADVTYAVVDSPVGPLLAATTRRGLVRLSYSAEAVDLVLQDLADRISPSVLEAPARLDAVRRELDEYFDHRRDRFAVPIDWRLTSGFTQRVLRATARIPYGSVTTYGDVARRAGSERAARAAGNALGSNPIPIVVPCHRVVHAGGGLGGYTGGLEKKEFLLELEGADLPDRKNRG